MKTAMVFTNAEMRCIAQIGFLVPNKIVFLLANFLVIGSLIPVVLQVGNVVGHTVFVFKNLGVTLIKTAITTKGVRIMSALMGK